MFSVIVTAEQQAKIDAKRAERAVEATKRNVEAAAAYSKALEEVDYDETKLIVHPMPEIFGGAVIHKVPAYEVWAITNKRIVKSLMSDGKKEDASVAISGLISRPELLVHPSLGDLAIWRKELPDLYSEIHNTMDARCSHGQTTGK